MEIEDLPVHPRKRPLLIIELPAHLNITAGQANDENNMRRFAAEKGKTLPDAIEVEADASEEGWTIVVWENPDNGPREIAS